jgi:hypothetical protein
MPGIHKKSLRTLILRVRSVKTLATGKEKKMKERGNRITCIFTVVVMLIGAISNAQQWNIQNPYETVDWQTYKQHKANLHTHTTMSDGRFTPAEAIDRYHELGYSVLAITDHDSRGPGNTREHPDMHKPTWPWQSFDRDPSALGMLAIKGNEVGIPHIVSLFNDFGNHAAYADESLGEIGRKGGLAIMAHPALYALPRWQVSLRKQYEIWRNPHPLGVPITWYTDLLRRYPHLLGVEVYIQVDRGGRLHRDIWDSILKEIGNERSVWAFSHDDMHKKENLGFNWNILFLPELSNDAVRQCLIKGQFFFAHASQGHQGETPPTVISVKVNSHKGIIRIQASGHERIEWISGGNIVHTGDMIELSKVDKIDGYVRAMVHGTGGTIVGSQPFGVQLRAESD